jgi:hypothetical protein
MKPWTCKLLAGSLGVLVANAAFAAPYIGVFRPSTGEWFLDLNHDNVWNGVPTDGIGHFGEAGDDPVVVGYDCAHATQGIMVQRERESWYWTFNDWEWDAGDQSFIYGSATQIPVYWRNHITSFTRVDMGNNNSISVWKTDLNDDHSDVNDPTFTFYGGTTYNSAIPIVGRWGHKDGSGHYTQDLGVFTPAMGSGAFFLDLNGNSQQDAGDRAFLFGLRDDLPVAGEWNPNTPGQDVFGTFRNGTWFIDQNGDRLWNGTQGGDLTFSFGQAGDIPVVAPTGWNLVCPG